MNIFNKNKIENSFRKLQIDNLGFKKDNNKEYKFFENEKRRNS